MLFQGNVHILSLLYPRQKQFKQAKEDISEPLVCKTRARQIYQFANKKKNGNLHFYVCQYTNFYLNRQSMNANFNSGSVKINIPGSFQSTSTRVSFKLSSSKWSYQLLEGKLSIQHINIPLKCQQLLPMGKHHWAYMFI